MSRTIRDPLGSFLKRNVSHWRDGDEKESVAKSVLFSFLENQYVRTYPNFLPKWPDSKDQTTLEITVLVSSDPLYVTITKPTRIADKDILGVQVTSLPPYSTRPILAWSPRMNPPIPFLLLSFSDLHTAPSSLSLFSHSQFCTMSAGSPRCWYHPSGHAFSRCPRHILRPVIVPKYFFTSLLVSVTRRY